MPLTAPPPGAVHGAILRCFDQYVAPVLVGPLGDEPTVILPVPQSPWDALTAYHAAVITVGGLAAVVVNEHQSHGDDCTFSPAAFLPSVRAHVDHEALRVDDQIMVSFMEWER